MTRHLSLMVPGARETGKLDVVAPFDQQKIASVGTADATGVSKALETAYRLYRDRDAWLPAHRRVEILERTAQMMREQRDTLALEAAREGGKPLMDSLVETDRAIDGVKSCVEALRTQSGREIPMNLNPASMGRYAFTHHEPRGVVVAFSAFNHPLNLIVHQVGPAIATGCPVIVKPAEATPLSCWRFVSLLHEAGLPAEWCQCLLAENHEVSGQLVSDPRVAFFSFIGSGRVGWMLRSKLAPGTRCALEHGGAAPAIVAQDADLERALPLLAKGGMYHAGQVCVSVQRVLAHSSIAETLGKRLAELAAQMKVGDPTLGETEVGPLIRPSEVVRVGEWVDEAVTKGATVLCGGKALSETCYEPTVLLNPSEQSRVSTQEIFGPVVCVSAYQDLQEALDRANSLPFAFQASIFTRDFDTAMGGATRLDAMSVMVNDHTAFRVDWMPFAGGRESGLGIGGIPYTMADMQIEKQIVMRSAGIS